MATIEERLDCLILINPVLLGGCFQLNVRYIRGTRRQGRLLLRSQEVISVTLKNG